MITFTLFAVFLLLVFLGAPIALCLGISSLIVLDFPISVISRNGDK